MLDYFLSPDWAITATTLLVGFFVISVILAVLVWRGQWRHSAAAERLLDERHAILRASEDLVGHQMQRHWPELAQLDHDQQRLYAERSLVVVEAMVGPWLDPKRHDLSDVARQFLQVRQEDLEQLLSIARAHEKATPGASEASSGKATEKTTEKSTDKATRTEEVETMDQASGEESSEERGDDVIVLHDVEIPKNERL
ncbi:MAG: hypothetical protein WCY71_00640 [Halothiobacillaceae bacterium]